VVAAREKHQPWTVKREPDLFAETQPDAGISAVL
jgi:ribonuclease HII